LAVDASLQGKVGAASALGRSCCWQSNYGCNIGVKKGGERSSLPWLPHLLKLQQVATNNNEKGRGVATHSYNLKKKKKK